MRAPISAGEILIYTRQDLRTVLTLTRNWIQYGLVGFTVACILIGALERLFGR